MDTSVVTAYVPIELPSAAIPMRSESARTARPYLDTSGGGEILAAVEPITDDLLRLRGSKSPTSASARGMLTPSSG